MTQYVIHFKMVDGREWDDMTTLSDTSERPRDMMRHILAHKESHPDGKWKDVAALFVNPVRTEEETKAYYAAMEDEVRRYGLRETYELCVPIIFDRPFAALAVKGLPKHPAFQMLPQAGQQGVRDGDPGAVRYFVNRLMNCLSVITKTAAPLGSAPGKVEEEAWHKRVHRIETFLESLEDFAKLVDPEEFKEYLQEQGLTL